MPANQKPRKRSGSEQYHDAFKPDPKPRKRVIDPELMARFNNYVCQITGLNLPGDMVGTHTHHLVKHPRHDEEDNLFRIYGPLHMEFEQGKRKQAVAVLIRAYMNQDQEDYVIVQKGAAWLDHTYPLIEWMRYHDG